MRHRAPGIEVVAAAIVRDGGVLAARRSRPPALAGCWEFPGGKTEPEEAAAAALIRECREELGVEIAVGAALDAAGDGVVRLTLYAATLIGGEPAAGEAHDEVRWLRATELDSVQWLPIDAALLRRVRSVLP